MTDINNYNTYPTSKSPPMRGSEGNNFNIEAHTSSNMKLERPKISAADISFVPQGKTLFSDKEATKRMQKINTDIYEGSRKEKSNHEFNFKRYFTIFGILALLTAAIGYFRKGK